jgi:sec-independent protein translocase protein TatA
MTSGSSGSRITAARRIGPSVSDEEVATVDLGWPEILIIALVVFALFGYKKLPDATRSIGRSLRIFKAETKGLGDDDKPQSPPSALEAPKAEPAAPDESVTGTGAGADRG